MWSWVQPQDTSRAIDWSFTGCCLTRRGKAQRERAASKLIYIYREDVFAVMIADARGPEHLPTCVCVMRMACWNEARLGLSWWYSTPHMLQLHCIIYIVLDGRCCQARKCFYATSVHDMQTRLERTSQQCACERCRVCRRKRWVSPGTASCLLSLAYLLFPALFLQQRFQRANQITVRLPVFLSPFMKTTRTHHVQVGVLHLEQ